MAEARSYQCPVCGAFAREGERACRHCATQLATLRCSRCFELNFPQDLHCRGCGHELGLSPNPEPSTLRCPDCKLALTAFVADGGQLHACEACGGQLVTHGLLRALLESRESLGRAALSAVDAPRGNPLKDPVRYRPCPACRQMMNRRNFGGTSGIVIDVCSLHGSFFDAGELPRVLEFVQRGGLARVRAESDTEASQRATKPLSLGSFARDPSGPAEGDLDVLDLLQFVVDAFTRRK